jgi:hypothetical protein
VWCGAVGRKEDIAELAAPGAKLLHAVEGWLRRERSERLLQEKLQPVAKVPVAVAKQTRTPFDMPSRHLAFFR